MKWKLFLLFSLGVLSISIIASGQETNERMERSFSVLAAGIDKLLLDTQHVFVKPTDQVKGFYLDNSGAIFIGNISMTAYTNIPGVAQDWMQWFSSADEKKITIETESIESTDPDSSTSEKDDEPNAEKKVTIKKYRQLLDADHERIENIDTHLKEFKKELINAILDFGPILKGLKGKDDVIVVFFVRDQNFQERYKTSNLILKVPFEKLKELQDKKATDPEIEKVFEFNIH